MVNQNIADTGQLTTFHFTKQPQPLTHGLHQEIVTHTQLMLLNIAGTGR
jgi:hypothetical protein